MIERWMYGCTRSQDAAIEYFSVRSVRTYIHTRKSTCRIYVYEYIKLVSKYVYLCTARKTVMHAYVPEGNMVFFIQKVVYCRYFFLFMYLSIR